MSSRVMASSAPNGSSISSSGGSSSSARQSAARCCMPPDSSRGSLSPKPFSPAMSRSCSARACRAPASLPASSAGSSTFCRIERHFSSTGAWKTMPMSGMGARTARPATVTVPTVAGRSPATMRSRVDLPQPLGPDQRDELARADRRAKCRRAPRPGRSPPRRSCRPGRGRSVRASRHDQALLRHLDLGEEVGRVDVLALDLLGQAHVGVHQVDRSRTSSSASIQPMPFLA